ncbi:MAG: TauD/TfdA family dioxygenase [Pseudomonadota bacterium]
MSADQKLLAPSPEVKLVLTDVIRRLAVYPYFVRLSLTRDDADPDYLRAQLDAIPGPAGVCVTRIRIEPDAPNPQGPTTQLSRTNRAMPLHTDSTYEERPHELIAFQMVQADRSGGQSILAPVDEVLGMLDDETVDALHQPLFPFGPFKRPILEGTGHQTRVRYYRRQIAPGLDPLQPKSAACIAAMNNLDHALAEVGQAHRANLQAGDLLVMNNHKVLHGRTALPADSARLMYRYRKHLSA